MFGKIEYLIINFIFLQATPDVGTFLLDKGEKVSVIALLSFLVYTLHAQGQKSAQQIKDLYEARIAELKEIVEDLQEQIQQIKKEHK